MQHITTFTTTQEELYIMTTYTITTRATDTSPKVDTKLTIDWTGTTPEQLQALALPSIVIKRQTYWRKHGIPASDTVLVAALASGRRVAPKPLTIDELFAQMSPIEQRKFLGIGVAKLNEAGVTAATTPEELLEENEMDFTTA